ncbi:unnamed protein product [Diatraea saccharalis]|uniref:Uncharacterized protein n=1 Tax=Diatraea saccharalis TaxID=40085 RepID=A0A9N9WIY0_9NEOP|nr:unnamed protein product [Diatraea saccharalis]
MSDLKLMTWTIFYKAPHISLPATVFSTGAADKLKGAYSLNVNNFDIELEGTIRFADEFMDIFGTRRSGKNEVARKDNEVLPEKSHFKTRRTDLEINAKSNEFLDQMAIYGKKEITYLAKHLQKIFNVKDDFVTILSDKVKDYERKLKKYIPAAIKYDAKCDIDKENIYLDIAAYSNMVLHNTEKEMLSLALNNTKGNSTDVQKVNEFICKTRIDHMKRVLDFLCAKINICRPYPGFSEYVVDLIDEIIKSSDSKLADLFKLATVKVEERVNFFKSFIKQNVLDMLSLKLRYISQDLNAIRKTLAIVKSIINSRYKMMKSDDDDLKLRTKAVRILLDVIDKAFNIQSDDLTVITFDTTVKAIRHWQNGNRGDIETPIKLLFDHIISVLRENWALATRQEVMTLTEVLTFGYSYDEGFNDLFARGSRFVRET